MSVKRYYSLVTDNQDRSADLYIFGDISDAWNTGIDEAIGWDFGEVSGLSIAKDLQGLAVDQINVHINSLGGYTAEGLAIMGRCRHGRHCRDRWKSPRPDDFRQRPPEFYRVHRSRWNNRRRRGSNDIRRVYQRVRGRVFFRLCGHRQRSCLRPLRCGSSGNQQRGRWCCWCRGSQGK